jgi:hypothetical protein
VAVPNVREPAEAPDFCMRGGGTASQHLVVCHGLAHQFIEERGAGTLSGEKPKLGNDGQI